MSSAELTYWLTVYNKEFLGAERQDYRFARLEAAACNFAGKALKEGATVSPLDCMPFREKAKAKSTRINRKAEALRTAAVFNAIIAKQQRHKTLHTVETKGG